MLATKSCGRRIERWQLRCLCILSIGGHAMLSDEDRRDGAVPATVGKLTEVREGREVAWHSAGRRADSANERIAR